MSADSQHIHLNLAAPRASFFRKLQHLLDVLRVLEVGVASVTQDQVAEATQFMSFQPANGSQLNHDDAKNAAQDWLLSAFLRDAIEATGLFLDECLLVCAFIELANKSNVQSTEVNQLLNVLPLKFHKLHFPEKLAKLTRDFGIQSPWSEHILSLNKIRTCVVHRLGLISQQDVDENNELVVTWRAIHLVAREVDSGKELILDRPGLLIEAESMVEMRFADHVRRFALGERVQLTHFELYSLIVTLWTFGMTCAEGIENFRKEKALDSHESQKTV